MTVAGSELWRVCHRYHRLDLSTGNKITMLLFTYLDHILEIITNGGSYYEMVSIWLFLVEETSQPLDGFLVAILIKCTTIGWKVWARETEASVAQAGLWHLVPAGLCATHQCHLWPIGFREARDWTHDQRKTDSHVLRELYFTRLKSQDWRDDMPGNIRLGGVQTEGDLRFFCKCALWDADGAAVIGQFRTIRPHHTELGRETNISNRPWGVTECFENSFVFFRLVTANGVSIQILCPYGSHVELGLYVVKDACKWQWTLSLPPCIRYICRFHREFNK